MRALGFPGKFEVLVDGIALDTVFGTQGNEWHWQDGGIIIISKPTVELSLHDLTGFNGRCDAILFSNDPNFTPPNALIPMTTFRQKLLGTTIGKLPGVVQTLNFIVYFIHHSIRPHIHN